MSDHRARGEPMYKKVLVPFDDSPSSQNALKNASQLLNGVEGSELVVLKVVEWHDYNAETFKIASRMSGVLDDSLETNTISEIGNEATNVEIARIRGEVEKIIGNAEGIKIAVVNGSPHDAIVAYASDNDFDCIVMGHRGLGVIRGMLGSVAYSVLQKADRPVLVVK